MHINKRIQYHEIDKLAVSTKLQ